MVLERWRNFDKLGWTSDMQEYFLRNFRISNVAYDLSKPLGQSRFRQHSSEDLQQEGGTWGA